MAVLLSAVYWTCVAYLNCSKIVLLLKYDKRFAFASMSTQYADAGEVNKYIIILEKPYCRPSIYETNGAGCVILAHIIQF